MAMRRWGRGHGRPRHTRIVARRGATTQTTTYAGVTPCRALPQPQQQRPLARRPPPLWLLQKVPSNLARRHALPLLPACADTCVPTMAARVGGAAHTHTHTQANGGSLVLAHTLMPPHTGVPARPNTSTRIALPASQCVRTSAPARAHTQGNVAVPAQLRGIRMTTPPRPRHAPTPCAILCVPTRASHRQRQ